MAQLAEGTEQESCTSKKKNDWSLLSLLLCFNVLFFFLLAPGAYPENVGDLAHGPSFLTCPFSTRSSHLPPSAPEPTDGSRRRERKKKEEVTFEGLSCPWRVVILFANTVIALVSCSRIFPIYAVP